MRIITRYLLTEFLRTLLLLIISFISLFLVIDFFERIDDFIESQVGALQTLMYFLFKTPFIATQMLPVAVLIGVIVSLGLLMRSHETTALRANGVSPHRIFFPFVITAVFITLASFVINELVTPHFNSKISRIWNVEVRKKPVGVLRHEKIWYKGHRSIYNLQVVDLKNQILEGVTIHKFNKDFNLTQRLDARSAEWVHESWHFHDGVIKTMRPDGSSDIEMFERKTFFLPESIEDFGFVQKAVEEMSYAELRDYVKRIEREGYSAASYLPDMYAKMSFPFVNIIMSVIGLAIIWRVRANGGISLGIVIGVATGFAYWVVHSISLSLGHGGVLPPMLSAWMANLIFGITAISLIRHIK